MAAPNIVNVTSIVGKSDGLNSITTNYSTLVTNPASSNQVYKINSVVLSNVNGTAAASGNVSLFKGSNEFRIAYRIFVPAGATLVVVSKDSALYLEENDSIKVSASLANYLQAICSYEVIS